MQNLGAFFNRRMPLKKGADRFNGCQRAVNQPNNVRDADFGRRFGKLVSTFHAARAANIPPPMQRQENLFEIAFGNPFPLADFGGFNISLTILFGKIENRQTRVFTFS